jgi:1-aminocyclopropane-1-carboxylate synthase 1/2/6
MVSRAAARLAADPPAIATAHFLAEADPYHPSANPDGYINLGTAESRLMWDLLEPVLIAPRSIHPSDIRYGPLYGTETLRTAIAALAGSNLARRSRSRRPGGGQRCDRGTGHRGHRAV